MRLSRSAVLFAVAGIISVLSVTASTSESEGERKADARSIRNVLKEWDRALVDGDYEAMSRLFSDDYFESMGVSRDAYVDMYLQMGVTYSESSRDNLNIRFYGDTAVVTGQWTSRGTTGQFGDFVSTLKMTDIWVKQDGKWKCVAVVPDDTRKAFARIGQVRIGPDVPSEIVILFRVGVSGDEIEAFRVRHLSRESDPIIPIASYARSGVIEEHAMVSIKLGTDVENIERKFLIERILKDPVVFRVFENIAPNEIALDE